MRFVDIRKQAAKRTAQEDRASMPRNSAPQAPKANVTSGKGTTSPITSTGKGPIIGPVYTDNPMQRLRSKRSPN